MVITERFTERCFTRKLRNLGWLEKHTSQVQQLQAVNLEEELAHASSRERPNQ